MVKNYLCVHVSSSTWIGRVREVLVEKENNLLQKEIDLPNVSQALQSVIFSEKRKQSK
jgi:hypothetical protein